MTEPAGYTALVSGAAAFSPELLGKFELVGADAHALVNRVSTADISRLPPGRHVDALLLNDDASILTTVNVLRFPDRMLLIVPGEHRQQVWDYLVDRRRGNARLRDISDEVTTVMVRGPRSAELLQSVVMPWPRRAGDLTNSRVDDVTVFAARVGEGGPEGIDLHCRSRDGEALMTALGQTGVDRADISAWQTVQIEWGRPTVGVEIESGDTPHEAGLVNLVAAGKGAPFPGEQAFAAREQVGPLKSLVTFSAAGAMPPPVGAAVMLAGRQVDTVRSSVMSPRFGILGMTAVPTRSTGAGVVLTVVSGDMQWEASVCIPPAGRSE